MKLTHQQRIALMNTCRLAQETIHPQFRRIRGRFSEVVTFNSGYE
jgi:hypothetical protein